MAELTMPYKLGKLPARPDAVKLKLTQYKTATLPTPPKRYGHQNLIPTWNMYGNDKYGDCVFAGAGHEHLLWNKEAGHDVFFTEANILEGYTEVTGFNPNDPSTDNGTDMELAAKWRRHIGLIDGAGKRHPIGAYLAIEAGNINQIKQAAYLFSAVGIGIQFPASAMQQFNDGKSWHIVNGSPIEGGHYVPVVGYDSRYIYVVTWGRVQKCTYGFIRKYMDEGIVYLSSEFITSTGKTLEGFDLNSLTQDLNGL